MTITVRVGLKGGSGSGNFGHRGRPGKLGGSTPKGAGAGGLSDPRGDLRAADDVGTYGIGSYKAIDKDAADALKRGTVTSTDAFDGDELAKTYKNEIVTELSEATGLPYEDVNNFVKQWSYSSNDTDMRSLSIQKAIADEFGLELSPWQKQRMTDLKYPNQKIALYQRQQKDINAQRSELLDQKQAAYKVMVNNDYKPEYRAEYNKISGALDLKIVALDKRQDALMLKINDLQSISTTQLKHIFEGHKDPDGDARRLVRAIYDNQQKQFKAKGITEITVFRGAEAPFAQRRGMQNGQTVGLKGNVAESWSAKSSVAASFAGREYRGGTILAVKVPAERVLTSAASGLGCLNEHEFVLLGSRFSKDTAYVMLVYFTSDEQKQMESQP